MDSWVAVDIETTGLKPGRDFIIEIGAVLISQGKIIEQFDELICPNIPIPERITELTGINNEMVKEKRTIKEVLPDFLAFVKELPWLGHNILFDYKFIKTECEKIGISLERSGVDTLYLGRKLLPDLSSKSLESLCSYYHIFNQHAHRACEDAMAANELYCLLKQQFYQTFAEEFCPKPFVCTVKKQEPITIRQKKFLHDLLKYHKIESVSIENLTKSQASRMIDKIILQHGKIPYHSFK